MRSRGSAYFNLERYDLAIMDLKLAIKQTKGDATLFYDLGNSFFMSGEFYKAIETFGEAIKLDSTSPEFYFNRALSYFYMEIYTEGCSDLQKAAGLDDAEAAGYYDEFCKEIY